MEITEKKSLHKLNTFGINCFAKYFVKIESVEDLLTLYKKEIFKKEKRLILGGGSNILLTKDFEGLVIQNNIKGWEIKKENENFIELEIGAGENWHQLVTTCVNNGWGGIENLSLIPGNAGTAPMQNIGAYGVEIKETFISLKAFEISTSTIKTFSKKDCQFDYRESVFKKEKKNQYIILSIRLKLDKKPKINIKYGDIKAILNENKISSPTIKDVSQAIIKIRQKKLPDPEQIGNSGSFFKNPIISTSKLNSIKKKYPEIVYYEVSPSEMKIAAGWLIDKAGWKGKIFGNYGVHENQALVLVNYGGANGTDIFNLSEKIINDIKTKFDIQLEREVNVL